ncbi:MAG: ComEC/Rec2 family competence protein [Allosphingosinicella sp.]|uniref:ComEC/Rec2 family competence protein n=1 Tax=Allosphingosinicella sp. TaxID=2823234 RepID=UPI0039349AC6
MPRQRGWREWAEAADARLESWFDRERDQLPLWLPVGLIAGVGAWFALPAERHWIAFLLVALGLFLGVLAWAGERRWGRALALFALAAAIGCALVWHRAERVAAPRLDRPGMATFEARILGVERIPARGQVRLMLAPDPPAEAERAGRALPPKLRITLPEDKADARLKPGARVRLRAYLMPPAPMAVPGAYDFARNAWFQGIGATGRLLGEVAVMEEARETGWRARVSDWRQRLADHVRSRIDGGAGGIAATLATGDRGGISEEDAEAMRRSGLAHLLSISGLYVTAVVGAAMLIVLKLLALSPTLALRWNLVLVAAGAGAAAGLGYTLLTGAEVPTIRACAAAMLVLIGVALGRDAITLRLVMAGALFVVLLWPESVAGPSFQLSFAAVTAIVALHEHPRIRELLARREEGAGGRLGRILLGLFLTGLAVEVALAPIALYHFHKAGLYGALANIVAIPLTTFVIMPAEALALLLDSVGLGAPFWWIAGVSLRLLLALAHFTANSPGSVAMLPTMPTGAFALMVAGGLWICLWRTRARRLGLLPVAIGGAWAIATPAPDLIVTGDGRHLALRTGSGELALLRGRAGDYVRSMLAETSGSEAGFVELADLGAAACSADLCAADIVRDGRRWRVLATRSSHHVRWSEMAAACAEADIVVSDRRLPDGCRPRWLKADRSLLRETGGLAVHLSAPPRIETVADHVGRHPWAPRLPPPGR